MRERTKGKPELHLFPLLNFLNWVGSSQPPLDDLIDALN